MRLCPAKGGEMKESRKLNTHLILSFQLNLLQCNKMVGCSLYQGLVHRPVRTFAYLLSLFLLTEKGGKG